MIRSRRARFDLAATPVPPPPPELAERLAAAMDRVATATAATAAIWSRITAVARAKASADSRLAFYVLADDAGPEVARELHLAEQEVSRAKGRLLALEAEAARLHADAERGEIAPTPTPEPGERDRVERIAG